jgi:hypothetical protein
MNWLIRLYPLRWRDRYGEEFAAVLNEQRLSVGLVLDVLGGAVDAHLHPQNRTGPTNEENGGDAMTNEMLKRCAVGGPRLSKREQTFASVFMIASALVMAGVYILLRKLYHGIPAVEAVGYASFPAIYLIYAHLAYLRKRPWLTQLAMMLASVGGMYLFMFGICVIADKL